MKIRLIAALAFAAVLSGCAANNMYYWGNYESTLYDYRSEPTDSNLTKHKQQLEKIISKGQSGKKYIPPGIYFELGMIEAKLGNTGRSIELLNLEKSLFPEATI